MRVTRVRAWDCLSFKELLLDLRGSITTITGPNSAGKSNLGQCVAFVRTAVERFGYEVGGEALADLELIGYDGAPAYRVGLDIEFDQPWERELLNDFVRAALAY